MEILLTGDKHLRMKPPIGRTDDFVATQLNKENQILDYADKIYHNKKCLVIQTGDFFDSHTPSIQLLNMYTNLYFKHRHLLPILTVVGEHDSHYHSQYAINRSPLKLFEEVGIVKILSSEPVVITCADIETNIYGMSVWDNDIPIPKKRNINVFNVLVAHKMIGDKKLWESQELTSPAQFMKKAKGFNLVVCGHYHYSFTEKVGNSYIINPGVSIRKNRNRELQHKPKLVHCIISKGNIDIKDVYLKVQNAEHIFNKSVQDDASIDLEYTSEFISSLKNIKTTSIDCREIIAEKVSTLDEKTRNYVLSLLSKDIQVDVE